MTTVDIHHCHGRNIAFSQILIGDEVEQQFADQGGMTTRRRGVVSAMRTGSLTLGSTEIIDGRGVLWLLYNRPEPALVDIPATPTFGRLSWQNGAGECHTVIAEWHTHNDRSVVSDLGHMLTPHSVTKFVRGRFVEDF